MTDCRLKRCVRRKGCPGYTTNTHKSELNRNHAHGTLRLRATDTFSTLKTIGHGLLHAMPRSTDTTRRVGFPVSQAFPTFLRSCRKHENEHLFFASQNAFWENFPRIFELYSRNPLCPQVDVWPRAGWESMRRSYGGWMVGLSYTRERHTPARDISRSILLRISPRTNACYSHC